MKNKNNFTLKDIKAGYLLVVRNENNNTVFNMAVLPGNYKSPFAKVGTLSCASADGNYYWPLSNFGNQFSYDSNHKFTIMEVYGYTCNSMLLKCSTEMRELLWKRECHKKMTVQQVCEALGYDVEIVKG